MQYIWAKKDQSEQMHSRYYRYGGYIIRFNDLSFCYGCEGVIDTHEIAMLYKFFANKEPAPACLAVIVFVFVFNKRFDPTLD